MFPLIRSKFFQSFFKYFTNFLQIFSLSFLHNPNINKNYITFKQYYSFDDHSHTLFVFYITLLWLCFFSLICFMLSIFYYYIFICIHKRIKTFNIVHTYGFNCGSFFSHFFFYFKTYIICCTFINCLYSKYFNYCIVIIFLFFVFPIVILNKYVCTLYIKYIKVYRTITNLLSIMLLLNMTLKINYCDFCIALFCYLGFLVLNWKKFSLNNLCCILIFIYISFWILLLSFYDDSKIIIFICILYNYCYDCFISKACFIIVKHYLFSQLKNKLTLNGYTINKNFKEIENNLSKDFEISDIEIYNCHGLVHFIQSINLLTILTVVIKFNDICIQCFYNFKSQRAIVIFYNIKGSQNTLLSLNENNYSLIYSGNGIVKFLVSQFCTLKVGVKRKFAGNLGPRKKQKQPAHPIKYKRWNLCKLFISYIGKVSCDKQSLHTSKKEVILEAAALLSDDNLGLIETGYHKISQIKFNLKNQKYVLTLYKESMFYWNLFMIQCDLSFYKTIKLINFTNLGHECWKYFNNIIINCEIMNCEVPEFILGNSVKDWRKNSKFRSLFGNHDSKGFEVLSQCFNKTLNFTYSNKLIHCDKFFPGFNPVECHQWLYERNDNSIGLTIVDVCVGTGFGLFNFTIGQKKFQKSNNSFYFSLFPSLFYSGEIRTSKDNESSYIVDCRGERFDKFNRNEKLNIDAKSFGNKSRFVNCSDKNHMHYNWCYDRKFAYLFPINDLDIHKYTEKKLKRSKLNFTSRQLLCTYGTTYWTGIKKKKIKDFFEYL